MALPGDVTTFDLHFGDDVEGYTDVTGAVTLLGAEGVIYPIDLATGKRLNLVHVATGFPILPTDVEFTLDDGGKAKAIVTDLPHTNNASLSVVGFGYQVEWKLATGSRHVSPGKKRFAVPTASGASVDYDLLDVAEAVPGVLVPIGTGPQGPTGPTGPGADTTLLLTKAANLSDVANAATARTNLGLGTAATQATGAFDAAGAATTAQAAAVQRANHTGTQAASTVTGLAVAVALVPTATKTASYTAAVGDLAMMNVASGGTVLNLPAAPADKSQVGYRAIGATTAVPLTINRGGSDTIGTAGATSASIVLADEVVVLQYNAANTRWLSVADVKTLPALDARFEAAGAAAAAVAAVPRSPLLPIVGDWTLTPFTGLANRTVPDGQTVTGELHLAAGTYDSIQLQVQIAGAAGSLVKAVVYAHDEINNRPGALLYESASVDAALAGTKQINSIGLVLTATQRVWIGLFFHSITGAVPSYRAVSGTGVQAPNSSSDITAAYGTAYIVTLAGTTTAPASGAAFARTTHPPRMGIHRSA